MTKKSQPAHQLLWNYWQSISEKIHTKLAALMSTVELDENDSSLKKAHLMFKTCLEMESHEKENSRHLKETVADLGGLPLMRARDEEGNGFDWGLQIVKVIKHVGIYPIFKVFPEVDYTNPILRTFYVRISPAYHIVDSHIPSLKSFQIQNGNVNLPFLVLSDPLRYSKKIYLYKRWIYESIKSLYVVRRSKQHVRDDIDAMVKFEMDLAKISLHDAGNSKRISIRKLSQITGLKWINLLQELISEVKVNITNDLHVVVNSLPALKQIALLINSTRKQVVGIIITT